MIANTLNPPRGSLRERDNRYYHLLAGGAKTRLLEAMLDLQIPELLGSQGPLTASQICRELSLDPHRGWKFLHLLALAGMLVEEDGDRGQDEARYSLSDEAKEYFGEQGDEGYFFRDVLQYYRNVADLPILEVLRGMPLPEAVKWPPPGMEAAEHLETWMRVTAEGALTTLLESGAFESAERLLDVGGGDGTIACRLTEQYPALDVTVFNLPSSAYLARRNIAQHQFRGRIGVHEGDFLVDDLPGGFDRVMFSRVLTDWTPDVCRMLFEKSAKALDPGGRLVINEALVEGNLDYALSWEFRYLYYDTFGRALFKPLSVYEDLLDAAGLRIVEFTPMNDSAFYSVIQAEHK